MSDCVWLDETFYSVRMENIIHRDNGDKLRGLSQNQICIGVATDKERAIFLVVGNGQPSQRKIFETFRNHIKPSSILIHDEQLAHAKLVLELSLESMTYSSKYLKDLSDKDNPVTRCHDILKKFLNAHSSFNRDNLQGYLNLFAFVTNPPVEMLEKVELVIKLAFQNPKLLRYRDFYALNPDVLCPF